MTFTKEYPTYNSGRTRFKRGMIPWNKGIKTGIVPRTAYKIGDTRLVGEKHRLWKGDNVGYVGLHNWVRRALGYPKKCSKCKSQHNIQWANKSHSYKRDEDDWLELCRPCHMTYDNMMQKAWITRRARI